VIAQFSGSIIVLSHRNLLIISDIARYSLSPNQVSLSSSLYAIIFLIINNVDAASTLERSRLAKI
jgi:hypothetical protein